jgi:hypothetical protein
MKMAYGEHCADQVERATDVISQHYLDGLSATKENARDAIRQAIWDQLVFATACGLDPDELINEIMRLCQEKTNPRTDKKRMLAEAKRIASTYKPGDLPTTDDPDPQRRKGGLQIQAWREAKERATGNRVKGCEEDRD